MKILVTGSSGHLGEAICRTLSKLDKDYIGLDIKTGDYTNQLGSVNNQPLLKAILTDVDYIIHTATLHKPHVGTHSKQDFVDTNITRTLNLLEIGLTKRLKGFIFTSTTSTYGDALKPKTNEPAVWITEEVTPIPKNIYGVTKNAAEDICQLFYRNHKLPCLILKTSRFFAELDDNKSTRELYTNLNIKANEFLYRRLDIADAVSAHLLALEKVEAIGFDKYILSATSPFQPKDLAALNIDAVSVVRSLYPDFEALYKAKGWKMLPKIGRVYVNQKARTALDWQPKYDFRHVLERLKTGSDFRSPLSLTVGIKRYHDRDFDDGPYPVLDSDLNLK